MKIIRHNDIKKDLRKLRRFPSPIESLEAWERLFSLNGLRETPGINSCSGFGRLAIYKGRVVPLREKVGKSKGYRVLFQIINNDIYKVLVFSRHGVYKTEGELMQLVRSRV